jgi:hypothetical protein
MHTFKPERATKARDKDFKLTHESSSQRADRLHNDWTQRKQKMEMMRNKELENERRKFEEAAKAKQSVMQANQAGFADR